MVARDNFIFSVKVVRGVFGCGDGFDKRMQFKNEEKYATCRFGKRKRRTLLSGAAVCLMD